MGFYSNFVGEQMGVSEYMLLPGGILVVGRGRYQSQIRIVVFDMTEWCKFLK